MKKLLNFIAGFFSADSPNSSKRLVGIVGAGFLFWTLYTNSHSETHIAPAETLVWGVVVIVCTSLGLASVKELSDLVNGKKDKTDKTEDNGNQ
jgi:thiol:disulfide interchange protein